MFVGVDGLDGLFADPIEGCGEADSSGDVGGSGFEFVGEVVEGGFFEGHGSDHVASALVGGHGLELVEPSVEGSDSHGAVCFVGGHGVEVAVDGLDVDGGVGEGLGSVDEDDGLGLVGLGVGFGEAGDFGDGIDGTGGVADVFEGDDAGPCV